MSELLPSQPWTERLRGAELAVPEPTSGESDSVLKLVIEFAALVRRHLLIIVAITAACVGYVWYKARHELPVYRANAVIRLADKGRELSGRLGSVPTNPSVRPFTDPVLSLIQVLQSRGVAEGVVAREAL